MRVVLAVLLSLLWAGLLPGCTPYIPVKPGFGTSALAPAAEIPPELAAFNNFDPTINGLLAQQLCATAPQPLEEKSLDAAGGMLVQTRTRCANHMPFLGIYQ